MKLLTTFKRVSISKSEKSEAQALSPIDKMCLWFRRKPDLESPVDPRFGNSHITSPIPGAYADPNSPPNTITVGSMNTSEPTPNITSRPHMSSISEISQQPHPVRRRDSEKISPRTEVPPSLPPQQSPQPEKQQSSHNSPQPSPPRQKEHRHSSSTQFSSHHSISGSPSPELSSKWAKAPDSDQKLSRPDSQQSPSHSPGHPPTGLNRTQSSQSGAHSGTTSPDPMPVHQAYIAPDQLSIGAKLSPGLTINSDPTPPTTGGLNSGRSNFSYGVGNSATTSPVEGRNPWSKSATASPTDGKNPWNSRRESQQSSSRLIDGSTAIKEEDKPTVKPPWERDIPVAVVPLPVTTEQKAEDAAIKEVKEAGRKDSGNRMNGMTKIYIPTLPSFKLGSAPKRMAKQQREVVEMSPETASPSPIDHWPGNM